MATKTKEEVVKEIEEVAVPTVPTKDENIKYRCDFESWEDYNKYTGLKG